MKLKLIHVLKKKREKNGGFLYYSYDHKKNLEILFIRSVDDGNKMFNLPC